jgi:hypothetical protein
MTNAQNTHPLGNFHPSLTLLLVTGMILLGGTGAVGDTCGTDTPRRQVRWYVDRGLNVEVRRPRLLEEVAGPASDLLLPVQAGFRLSVDGAAFAGDDQGAEPGGVRRAYIRVGGEFWPWRRPVKYGNLHLVQARLDVSL